MEFYTNLIKSCDKAHVVIEQEFLLHMIFCFCKIGWKSTYRTVIYFRYTSLTVVTESALRKLVKSLERFSVKKSLQVRHIILCITKSETVFYNDKKIYSMQREGNQFFFLSLMYLLYGVRLWVTMTTVTIVYCAA